MITRRTLVSAAGLLLASSMMPVEAATRKTVKGPKGQIYLFRGFANIFSTGLDALGKELNAQGIEAQVQAQPKPEFFARRIAERYRASKDARPVILVGHSLGADASFAIARALQPMKVPVALIISFDPTGQGPVPGNVKKTINFFTGDEKMWSPVKPASDFKGDLANINLREGETAIKGIGHFNVEKNPDLHKRAIKEIKSALKRR